MQYQTRNELTDLHQANSSTVSTSNFPGCPATLLSPACLPWSGPKNTPPSSSSHLFMHSCECQCSKKHKFTFLTNPHQCAGFQPPITAKRTDIASSSPFWHYCFPAGPFRHNSFPCRRPCTPQELHVFSALVTQPECSVFASGWQGECYRDVLKNGEGTGGFILWCLVAQRQVVGQHAFNTRSTRLVEAMTALLVRSALPCRP